MHANWNSLHWGWIPTLFSCQATELPAQCQVTSFTSIWSSLKLLMTNTLIIGIMWYTQLSCWLRAKELCLDLCVRIRSLLVQIPKPNLPNKSNSENLCTNRHNPFSFRWGIALEYYQVVVIYNPTSELEPWSLNPTPSLVTSHIVLCSLLLRPPHGVVLNIRPSNLALNYYHPGPYLMFF